MNQIITESQTDAPLELVGGKARGLLVLKSLEQKLNEAGFISNHSQIIVPQFFIVPNELDLVREYKELQKTAQQIGTSFAVRSSSPLEDSGENSFDGIFETFLDVPLSALPQTISTIRKSATSQKAKDYSNERGIELTNNMPVIVQKMVKDKSQTGVVYSRFPCPRDILKVIRDDVGGEERHFNAFSRLCREDGTNYLDVMTPPMISKDWEYMKDNILCLGLVALTAEDRLNHPIIMEFATYESNSSADKFKIFPLQARKLTKLTESIKFKMPELQEKGLIATTYNINGTGDFTGEAYVIPLEQDHGIEGIETPDINEFDASHPQGYILVAPYLQFYHTCLDRCTPNKKAVIAFTDLGEHHDMELSRTRGILYLNTKQCLGMGFYQGQYDCNKLPIRTGEKVRVVSNGERGLVFNLSCDPSIKRD